MSQPQHVPPQQPPGVLPLPRSPKPLWKQPAGIFLMIFGAAILAVVINGVVNMMRGDEPSPMRAEVTSCSLNGDRAVVQMRVTNTGSETADAEIAIEFRDASGARVDTDRAYIRGIRAGDTAAHEEVTYLDAPATGGQCGVGVIR